MKIRMMTITVIFMSAAFTMFGYDAWNSGKTYSTAGTLVEHGGKVWKNSWWTKGENPELSGQWGVWKVVENTVTDPDPVVDPTPDPDPVIDPAPEPAPVTTGTWDQSTVYNGGDTVAYNGKTYKAGWWTQGESPELSGQWGVWKVVENIVTDPTLPEEPVINNDTALTTADTSVMIDALANDTGNSLIILSVTYPANGTTVIMDNKIEYTPDSEFKGTDSFEYSIIDLLGTMATGLVSVTVNDSTSVAEGKVNATFWSAWGGNTSYNIDGKQIVSAPVEMDKIDPSYNVIITAFIITDENGNYVLALKDPGSTKSSVFSPEQVKQFIEKTKAQGRKVIVSMGGALFHISMKTEADGENFVKQTKNIIDEYGFDGIDIDLEGTALASVDPVIMEKAIMDVVNHYRDNGADFWLTAAPEWCYIIPFMYGSGQWASHSLHAESYKDLINNIGIDNFTYIWPQSYNGGPANGVAGPDGSKVTPVEGMDEFLAALAWGLSTIEGYEANGSMGVFIPTDKLCLGIPATEGAAGSAMTYVATPALIQSAMSLMKSQNVSISGFMNWSVDWDAMNINDGDLSDGYTHSPWETGRTAAEVLNL